MNGYMSPIFIGGLSHSGKTQLRMVLDAHPELALTRRTYMWERFYGRFGDLREPANVESCLSVMLRDSATRQLEPDAARIRRDFAQRAPTYATLFGIFHEHAAERQGKRRWGDQLGFVERFADPIFSSFPTARMVHMIRDPRGRHGVLQSSRRARAGLVGWDTARWMHSAELAERNQYRYPEQYRVVRYEALAARPMETIGELCDFLGEDFLPGMTATIATLRFDDLRPDSSSHTQTSFVHRYTRQRLPSFGYAPREPERSPRHQLMFALAEWPLNRAGMTAWRVLKNRPLAKRVGS
jgi:hypothetical protein